MNSATVHSIPNVSPAITRWLKYYITTITPILVMRELVSSSTTQTALTIHVWNALKTVWRVSDRTLISVFPASLIQGTSSNRHRINLQAYVYRAAWTVHMQTRLPSCARSATPRVQPVQDRFPVTAFLVNRPHFYTLERVYWNAPSGYSWWQQKRDATAVMIRYALNARTPQKPALFASTGCISSTMIVLKIAQT